MTRPDTWMPIYWGDYYKDTNHLSAEEHGAYFLMIGYYWSTGQAIKNDKKTLKNITKLLPKKLENVLKFFEEKEGYLHHARIEMEIKKAIDNKEKQRKRTEAATRARHKKEPSVTEDVTSSVTPTPSPSPTTSVVLDDDVESVREEVQKPDDEKIKTFREISGKIQDIVNAALPLNTQRVYSWLEAGADEDLILQTLKAVMAKRNNTPVNSLNYFDSAIATAIHNKTKPLNMEQTYEISNRNTNQNRNFARKSTGQHIAEGVARIAEEYGIS